MSEPNPPAPTGSKSPANRPASRFRSIAKNWFLFGLALALLSAWLVPAPGSRGGILFPEWSTKAAVFIIFLNSGLTLPVATILPGLSAWRLHLYVQTFLFVGAPLIFLTVLTLLGDSLDPHLRLGFWFLAVLPSTISTAVVMSTSSGGDPSVALFNVTLSNLLGVLLVPAVCIYLVGRGTGDLDGLAMIMRTATMILPPLILGMLVRPLLHQVVDRFKGVLGSVNNALILFICYVSFAQSVADRTWERLGAVQIATAISLSALLVLLLMTVSALLIRAFKFPHPLAVSGFFCSTQKTLAAGAPMALAIFVPLGIPTGPIFAPLLCFYALSLAASGAVVARLAAQKNQATEDLLVVPKARETHAKHETRSQL